tara:strand:+ start:600 stop:1079 length:480 start_codon:yes stop_codon:yes gene_type:complete
MNSKVTVLSDETTGAVVNLSENNPDYGYIRVQQQRTMIDDNGFLRRKSISALVPGTVSELNDAGFYAGQLIEGKIVVEESLEPFNTKTPERDLKVAGETGIVCTIGGQPIYRRTMLSFDAATTDALIKHDNVEELRAAYDSAKAKSALKANKDFDLGAE